jgi:hypothetical protein
MAYPCFDGSGYDDMPCPCPVCTERRRQDGEEHPLVWAAIIVVAGLILWGLCGFPVHQ